MTFHCYEFSFQGYKQLQTSANVTKQKGLTSRPRGKSLYYSFGEMRTKVWGPPICYTNVSFFCVFVSSMVYTII